MLLALVALVALLAALPLARRTQTPLAAPPEGRGSGWLALALVAVSLAPLAWAWPRLVASDALLPSDAQAHAWVAQQVARGLPHGWVDVCACGFPFGPQYQSIAVLLTAMLIKAGVPLVTATSAVGIGAVLALPLLVTVVLRASGAPAPAAALGGAMTAWCAMPFAWTGVLDAYLVGGLVSQSLGLVVILVAAWAVLSGPAWLAPLAASLGVGTHMLLSALALLLAAPAIVFAPVAVRRRFVWAGAGACVTALAVYGPGLPTMHLPVGWSRGSLDLVRTFPRHGLPQLAAGDLLDYGRAPGFTALVLVALIGMALSLGEPRVRATLTLLGGVLLASGAARIWGGVPIVELVGPVRAASFVPFCIGVSVATGTEIWLRPLGARARTWVPWLIVTIVLGWGAATRWPWLRERLSIERSWRGEHECGGATPVGYRTPDVAAWLSTLPAGRFVVDEASFSIAPGVPLACPSLHGLELASLQPLGASAGGPGSQNGILNDAFEQMRVGEPGGDARAEALGVRTVLHTRAHRPVGEWTVIAGRGDVELSARRGGTGIMGVGCVRSVWRGTDRAIYDRLLRPQAWPALLDTPARFVEIQRTTQQLVEADVAPGTCDPDGALLTELPREAGAYAADLRALHDVDVIVRATAFSTWRVLVDGASTPTRLVLPGFFVARVPAGFHRVEAVVSALPYYGEGLVAGAMSVLVLALLANRDRRARSAATSR